MSLPSLALPGQLLGPVEKYLPGPGTHIHESQIYASIAGSVVSTPSKRPNTTTTSSKLTPLLSITRPSPLSAPGILGPSSGSGVPLLPSISSTVLARITRLGPRFATCEILTIDDTVCREAFQGQIRREDIRATEKDKVKVEESFRVGDRNEFGVVLARGEGGEVLVPVSWCEVMEVKTGRRESRKVAKPF